nr:unnamed protein product [Digitaria exilis]
MGPTLTAIRPLGPSQSPNLQAIDTTRPSQLVTAPPALPRTTPAPSLLHPAAAPSLLHAGPSLSPPAEEQGLRELVRRWQVRAGAALAPCSGGRCEQRLRKLRAAVCCGRRQRRDQGGVLLALVL